MRNWATFESSITVAPSSSSYPSHSSFGGPAPSPRISPRGKSAHGPFFSSHPPVTPTHPPPASSSSSYAAAPSPSYGPPSSFAPSTPALRRQASASAVYIPQPLPAHSHPAQSATPSSAYGGGGFTTPSSSSASFARSSVFLPPSTPSSSSSALRSSSRPFSSYSTFPSLSAGKASTVVPPLSSPLSHSRAATAAPPPPSYAVRSLVSPAVAQRSRPYGGGAAPATVEAVQAVLQSSALSSQYAAWKAIDRQARLGDYLCVYVPVLAALLTAFALRCSTRPWEGMSVLGVLLLLLFVLLQAALALLHVRGLIARPPPRVSVLGLRVALPSASDFALLGAYALAALLGAHMLYWAQPSIQPPLSSTAQEVLRFGLFLSPVSLLALLLIGRPAIAFSTPAMPLHAILRRLLPTAVDDAAHLAAIHCVLVTVGTVLYRRLLGPSLGWLLGRTLVGLEEPGTWAGFLHAVLLLLKLTLLLLLSASLSLRLLAALLARPVAFPLPHLVLALYDSADRLYRRLGLASLTTLLSMPNTRPLLFSSLAALFPDLSSPTAPPSSALVASWSTVAAVATAALAPLRQLTSVLQQRVERTKRRRVEARQLLQQLQGAEDVVDGDSLDDSTDFDEIGAWAQAAAGLLEAVPDDRSRVLDPFLVPLLSALLELHAAVHEWVALLGSHTSSPSAEMRDWTALARALEDACARMVRGLQGRLPQLELPAKHRDTVHRILQTGIAEKKAAVGERKQ